MVKYAALLKGAPMPKEEAKPAIQSGNLTRFLNRGVSIFNSLIARFCAIADAVKTRPARIAASAPSTWRILSLQHAQAHVEVASFICQKGPGRIAA